MRYFDQVYWYMKKVVDINVQRHHVERSQITPSMAVKLHEQTSQRPVKTTLR